MNTDIQHVQLRALSNYVEPRNRAGWQVELAIDKLNQTIVELLNNIEKPAERNKALDWL
jgi:futalosine hydrolase